jgi:hypothetical protein
VHLYENAHQPDGEVIVTRRHSWLAPGAPRFPIYEANTVFNVRALGFGPWMAHAAEKPLQMRRGQAPPQVKEVAH